MMMMICGGHEANDIYYLNEDPRGGGAATLNSSVSLQQWHNHWGHLSLQKLKYSIHSFQFVQSRL